MPYLNIDTKKGIIAHGTGSMEPLDLSPEPGTCFFEAWANGIRRIREDGVEYKGKTLYKMEPGGVEDGYLWYAQSKDFKERGGVSNPENDPYVDAAVFESGKLHKFRVWGAEPNITVIKDGEIVAENVKEYQSWMPLWQKATIGVGAVALVGVIGRWADWW